MKINTQGTAVLVMITIVATASMLLMVCLQTTTFFRRLAGDLIISQKNTALSQGLLKYGIVQAHKNYEFLIKKSGNVQLEFDLPTTKGYVSLVKQSEGIMVASWITQDGLSVAYNACTVVENEQKKLIIQGFQSEPFAL